MVQRRETLLGLHALGLDYNFRWQGKEICPIIKEFQALMESRREEEIMPQPHFGHAQALGQMCGLTLHEARSLAHNRELDIPNLIQRFFDVDDRGDLLWQSFRQYALCLCMLAHFLLAPSFRGSSIRLIKVAQGLKEGKSCIGLVLAETLMGLDAFYQWETTRFEGSPLLLQVWVMDKLKVMDSFPEYLAQGYFFYYQLVNFLNEGCFWPLPLVSVVTFLVNV
ncbi:hypothetical protein CsSME_00005971 [Camellia sinensis var. sinensis]